MTTLGEQLRKNIAADDARKAQALLDSEKTEQRRLEQLDETAKAFFIFAKSSISTGIAEGKCRGRLEVAFGIIPSSTESSMWSFAEKRYAKVADAFFVADLGLRFNDGRRKERSVTDTLKPHWEAFGFWCYENRLVVDVVSRKANYCSWLALTISPLS